MAECIRCGSDGTKEIARLGVAISGGLVEKWRCGACRKVFYVEYQENGDMFWLTGNYRWPKIPKERKNG